MPHDNDKLREDPMLISHVHRRVVVAAVLIAAAENLLPVSAQERVMGVDISYWNCGTSSTGISQANWTTGYTTGSRQFAFLRATRGGTTGVDQPQGTPGGGSLATLSHRYDDPRFVQNINRATTAGMLAGPYHFIRPDVAGNTGTDEADHFIQMAGAWMRPGYMMPVLDQEAGSGSDTLAQFAIDFSDRIYAVMQIRPAIYINGSYSSTFQGATVARRDLLAKSPSATPGVVSPAYPMLWDAYYTTSLDIQADNPKDGYAGFYGPWDDYGTSHPWSFWQHTSTASVSGFNNVDASIDSNVAHGDIEYVRNFLVPAIWWNNSNGDWSVLTNWNSGQTPVAPVTPPDQATPYATGPIPSARLPGATGSGPTSGQYDTVILERPNANITVTLSSGSYNIRKLYMRETLNITGGSLTINYNPTYRPDDSATVLHGGPVSAQFSGPVTLSNSAMLSVHTLQVDSGTVFNAGGITVTSQYSAALTFNSIHLMPHSTTPAKLVVIGPLDLRALTNGTAIITNGAGSGSSGRIDLSGSNRILNITNGTDLFVWVPLTNGAVTKSGLGTMRLGVASTYTGGTTISGGKLLVNNPTGSGTGTGIVTVSSGTLGGTGRITGTVTVNSTGTISPGIGSTIGTLTLTSVPTLNGTNIMKIDRNGGSSLADKITLTSGTLNYGGRLVVSNVGAALVGGEVFTNFSASAYSGAFSSTNLPTLNSGLNWYLGSLVTNGTIKVNRGPVVSNPLTFTNVPMQLLQIPILSLRTNATDADADTINVSSITLTTTNGITMTTNSTFIFYSNNMSVADRFTYTINDGRGGTATGTVNIVASPMGRFTSTPTISAGSVTLHLAGRAGWPYYLDRSTNLPVWQTISTNTAPANGFFDVTDNFQDLGASPPAAFYRLRSSP